MKLIRKFFHSRAGNITIIAIVIIPTLLLIFSSVVSSNRRINIQKTETLISLDSFCDYANENFGLQVKKDGNDFCSYTLTNKTDINKAFSNYFCNIDGYNKLWNYDISYDDTTGEFTITCVTYLPKISSSMSVVNYWGKLDENNNYRDVDGWYIEHNETMKVLFQEENIPNNRKSNNYWIVQEIKVVSSCA